MPGFKPFLHTIAPAAWVGTNEPPASGRCHVFVLGVGIYQEASSSHSLMQAKGENLEDDGKIRNLRKQLANIRPCLLRKSTADPEHPAWQYLQLLKIRITPLRTASVGATQLRTAPGERGIGDWWDTHPFG